MHTTHALVGSLVASGIEIGPRSLQGPGRGPSLVLGPGQLKMIFPTEQGRDRKIKMSFLAAGTENNNNKKETNSTLLQSRPTKQR